MDGFWGLTLSPGSANSPIGKEGEISTEGIPFEMSFGKERIKKSPYHNLTGWPGW